MPIEWGHFWKLSTSSNTALIARWEIHHAESGGGQLKKTIIYNQASFVSSAFCVLFFRVINHFMATYRLPRRPECVPNRHIRRWFRRDSGEMHWSLFPKLNRHPHSARHWQCSPRCPSRRYSSLPLSGGFSVVQPPTPCSSPPVRSHSTTVPTTAAVPTLEP